MKSTRTNQTKRRRDKRKGSQLLPVMPKSEPDISPFQLFNAGLDDPNWTVTCPANHPSNVEKLRAALTKAKVVYRLYPGTYGGKREPNHEINIPKSNCSRRKLIVILRSVRVEMIE